LAEKNKRKQKPYLDDTKEANEKLCNNSLCSPWSPSTCDTSIAATTVGAEWSENILGC